jgi:hypothetical protein
MTDPPPIDRSTIDASTDASNGASTSASTGPSTGASTDASTGASTGRSSSRARSIAAGIVGVIAVIGLVIGIVGFWTVRTATDSDRFEDRVEELLVSEEVSDGLSRRVVAEVATEVGIREAVIDVVPEVLRPVVDLVGAGVRARVEDRLAELIRQPEVAETIAAAAGRAHGAAINVLEGDAGVEGVEVTDGEVRINLLPLTARAIGVMQEVGLFRDVTVPVFDRSGDPDEQRAELEAALDRDLPDEFGQPVVFRSDSLDRLGETVERAQDLFLLAKRASWALILVGAGLGALAIWLSRARWRAACWLVAGLFLFTLVLGIVMDRVGARLPEAVAEPGAQETVRQVADGLETSLNRTMMVYSSLALLALAVVAFVQLGLPWWQRRRAQPA